MNRMSVCLIRTAMSYCVVIDRFTVSAVIHQRSCSIMSSFDYGQTALLRFVEQVVQQIEVGAFAALTSTAILCYSAYM